MARATATASTSGTHSDRRLHPSEACSFSGRKFFAISSTAAPRNHLDCSPTAARGSRLSEASPRNHSFHRDNPPTPRNQPTLAPPQCPSALSSAARAPARSCDGRPAPAPPRPPPLPEGPPAQLPAPDRPPAGTSPAGPHARPPFVPSRARPSAPSRPPPSSSESQAAGALSWRSGPPPPPPPPPASAAAGFDARRAAGGVRGARRPAAASDNSGGGG